MPIEVTGDMPANVEMEVAVLGAVLLDNLCWWQAATLDASDFSLDSHRRIFLRMKELAESGIAIDMNTLTDQLGKYREIESVGGVRYISNLTDGLPRVKNIGHYVAIVRDKSLLRGLINNCCSTANRAFEQAEPAREIIASSLDKILGLQTGGTDEPRKADEFGADVLTKLEHKWDNPGQTKRYGLAIPGLTRRTGGLLQGEYAVLMGRTGDGKTGLATQIALDNALEGRPVLIFALELSKEIMYQRMLCQISKVSNSVVIKHREEPLPSEREKIRFAKTVLDAAPIFFDDSSGLSAAQFVAKSKQWKRRYCEEEEGLIITDYMQKFFSKFRDQRDKMTEISEAHRRLAKDEKTRVLGLSQMGRPEGKNANQRPTKFDAKESGSIENDATLLMSVFRPVDDNRMPIGQDELVTVKNRDGESGVDEVEYRGYIYTFVPRAPV